jgi:hypothetical protein
MRDEGIEGIEGIEGKTIVFLKILYTPYLYIQAI